MVEVELVVFTCTFYKSAKDLRCLMCLRTIKLLKSKGIPCVIVDDSPDHTSIKELMINAGATMVQKQKTKGKKGAALREAAVLASTQINNATDNTWLCWQEAEKYDMANHWINAITSANLLNADILNPTRNDMLFKKTYPIEQYHSENFANMYLNAVAKDYITNNNNNTLSNDFPNDLDWHFGPIAFKKQHTDLWTNYNGIMYEAQLCPIVYAARKGLAVCTVEVPFNAPLEMKEQEEGNVIFIEKRLAQINDLDPKVKSAWTDDLPY